MKKEEKEELLEKDVDEIKDDEVNDYIKKYVRLRRVNRAKIATIALVAPIVLGTIGGTLVGGLTAVNKPYDEVNSYNVRYVDEDTNMVIQDNLKEKDKTIITIKYPYEKKDGYYVRKISEYTTKDDVSTSVNDIINSNPDFLDDLVNLKDESTNYEVEKEIDANDNNTEISVLYYEYLEKNKIYKSKDEKSNEIFVTFLCTIIGLLGGGKLSFDTLKDSIVLRYKDIINSSIKTLKKRKEKTKINS